MIENKKHLTIFFRCVILTRYKCDEGIILYAEALRESAVGESRQFGIESSLIPEQNS